MFLLDSARSSRPGGAVIDIADGIVDEIAELQRENSALVAELRRQRRRRTIKRLRRFSFVGIPIARAAARRFTKKSKGETPTAPPTPPPGPDPRVRLIILALVLRRIMVSSGEPTSAQAVQTGGPLPTSSEVHP